jgi:hypothetical protein
VELTQFDKDEIIKLLREKSTKKSRANHLLKSSIQEEKYHQGVTSSNGFSPQKYLQNGQFTFSQYNGNQSQQYQQYSYQQQNVSGLNTSTQSMQHPFDNQGTRSALKSRSSIVAVPTPNENHNNNHVTFSQHSISKSVASKLGDLKIGDDLNNSMLSMSKNFLR